MSDPEQNKEEIAADMVDFIGGVSGIGGLWARFMEWMQEKGYSKAEVEEAIAEIRDDAGRC